MTSQGHFPCRRPLLVVHAVILQGLIPQVRAHTPAVADLRQVSLPTMISKSYYTWYTAKQKSCSGMAANSCPAVIATYNITIAGVSTSYFNECVQIKPQ
jgi:hypothetical protein